jgi:hypothetical protein
MRPIGAFDQDVGEDLADELAGRIFVKEGDGVDGSEGQDHGGAFAFGDYGAGRTFHAPYTGVRIQGKDQDVAEAARLFEETNVAGMEQVIAAVGEDDGFALAFPEGTLFD